MDNVNLVNSALLSPWRRNESCRMKWPHPRLKLRSSRKSTITRFCVPDAAQIESSELRGLACCIGTFSQCLENIRGGADAAA
jgi:hypothetical protein